MSAVYPNDESARYWTVSGALHVRGPTPLALGACLVEEGCRLVDPGEELGGVGLVEHEPGESTERSMRSLGQPIVVRRKAPGQEHLTLVILEVREDAHGPTAQGVALMQRPGIIGRHRFHSVDERTSRAGEIEDHPLARDILTDFPVQAAVLHRELVGKAGTGVVNSALGAPHERTQLPAFVRRIEAKQPISE